MRDHNIRTETQICIRHVTRLGGALEFVIFVEFKNQAFRCGQNIDRSIDHWNNSENKSMKSKFIARDHYPELPKERMRTATHKRGEVDLSLPSRKTDTTNSANSPSCSTSPVAQYRSWKGFTTWKEHTC